MNVYALVQVLFLGKGRGRQCQMTCFITFLRCVRMRDLCADIFRILTIWSRKRSSAP